MRKNSLTRWHPGLTLDANMSTNVLLAPMVLPPLQVLSLISLLLLDVISLLFSFQSLLGFPLPKSPLSRTHAIQGRLRAALKLSL